MHGEAPDGADGADAVGDPAVATAIDYRRLVAEMAEDHIFVVDSRLRFMYANPCTARSIGAEPDAVVGRPMRDFYSPDTLSHLQAHIRQVLETGLVLRRMSPVVVANDEAVRWFDATLVPLRGTGGKVCAVMGIARDITDRKNVEDSLKRANDELVAALTRSRRLPPLIPICAKCKRIRDSEGRWRQIEAYIREHTGADFSHGYCPTCFHDVVFEITGGASPEPATEPARGTPADEPMI